MKRFCFFLLLSLSVEAATYHVQGECEAELTPDRASVSLGVTKTDKSAVRAQAQNTEVYNKLVEKIKATKLAHEELKTTGVYLYEDFDWIKGKRSSKGFVSSLSLTLSTSDFAQLSSLIAELPALGASSVGQLNLYVSSTVERKAYQDCLSTAAQHARQKAQAMQKGFGSSSLKLKELRESTSPGYAQPYALKSAMAMEASDASPAPSIEAGKQRISVKIDAIFED